MSFLLLMRVRTESRWARAILVLSLQDFNFPGPSLAERVVAFPCESYSTCRELKFASVKAVISASIRYAL